MNSNFDGMWIHEAASLDLDELDRAIAIMRKQSSTMPEAIIIPSALCMEEVRFPYKDLPIERIQMIDKKRGREFFEF